MNNLKDKKVLILSCNTGEGHNSAAKALNEYLTDHGAISEVKDTLTLVSQTASNLTSDIYVFSTKSDMFKMAYQAGAVVSNISQSIMKSPVYMANKLYCNSLYDYIVNGGFDAVVCVHLFPAEAVTALKRNGKMPVKTIFIMTDYTCIPFMAETELDYYVLPHEDLIEECATNGIPREKMRPFGIPVRKIFHTTGNKTEARQKCLELFSKDIDTNKNWFMIMSGSMGFGDVENSVKEVIAKHSSDTVIFLICGNNAKLKSNLEEEFGNDPAVVILGFTHDVPTLMDACDVIFTKPGGLSSTEAAAKQIPLIHTAPIPGCETRNAEFFHYHNMSYASTDPKQQVVTAARLCTDEAYRRKMQHHQKENINPHTCRDIASLIVGG